MSLLMRAWRGVRWFVRESTGEARWDAYVERCTRDDVQPLSRRVWERHRADAKEHDPRARCC